MRRRDLQRVLNAVTDGSESTVLAKKLRPEAEDLRLAARRWVAEPGIQGFGIAERITDGKQLPELALKVYVAEKLPESKLDGVVPGRVKFPGAGLEAETDVEAIGEVRLEGLTSRIRPARPGFSVNHANCGRGTFGCVVRRAGSTELFLLSNSHVIGDFGVASRDDPVFQPSTEDDSTQIEENTIAKFTESINFIFTESSHPNLADAAIAELLPGVADPRIHFLGLPTGVNDFPRRGMSVQKVGCVSDHSVSEIKDIDFMMSATFKRPGGGFARVGFRQQILCRLFTGPGDSGAAVLTSTGKLIGLHFAGSPSTSIFNRIGPILQALNLEVVTVDNVP